ncbi:hypothetical protein AAMO2058_000921600 [Amorphochlora amoebiformis]
MAEASRVAPYFLTAVLLFGGIWHMNSLRQGWIASARSRSTIKRAGFARFPDLRRGLCRSTSLRKSSFRAEEKGHEVGHQDGRARREPTEQELRIMEHQKNAPKLSFAEEAKSLVTHGNGYGVISTVSSDGYPGGAVVMYAPDDDGLPVFSFSTLSSHTQDLMKSSKASITVQASGFRGAADARVNLMGDIENVTDESIEQKYRDIFMKKHPEAFWVAFGDFAIYRMTSLKAIRFVGGFARAANVPSAEYLKAEADPIMGFADKIAGHMNDDHQDATKAIVKAELGLDCEKAEIKVIDRLGMTVFVSVKQPDETISPPFKLRIGFPEPCNDRPGVRDMLKKMTMDAVQIIKSTSPEAAEA